MVLIVGSAIVLAAGLVIGLLPVSATLTEISPQLRLVTASCGDGYLPASPPVRPGDLVEQPAEPPVLLPRTSYAEHCTLAVGWRRYVSWILTVLGALGLAVCLADTRRSRLGR
jgi:hypothetical protein